MQLGKQIQKREYYIQKANEVEDKYNIPRNLLVGLLQTESGFSEDVITGKRKSSAGAIGIAQFMPNTAKEYGIDPLNVDQAIDAAGRYLQKSYNTFGNWDDSLRSYNMGVQGVKDWKAGKRSLPQETAEYTGKVYKYAGVEQPKSENIETKVSFTFTEKPNMQGINLSSAPEEEKSEELKQIEKADKNLELEERKQKLFEQFNKREPQEQEVVQQQTQAPEFNVLQTYQEVDQFVSNPIMQQGGQIPTSPNGVFDYPNQIVNVPTNGSITMQGVDY